MIRELRRTMVWGWTLPGILEDPDGPIKISFPRAFSLHSNCQTAASVPVRKPKERKKKLLPNGPHDVLKHGALKQIRQRVLCFQCHPLVDGRGELEGNAPRSPPLDRYHDHSWVCHYLGALDRRD